jgi:hypothetical protein
VTPQRLVLLLVVVGALLVSVGAGLVFLPAGLIVGGGCLAAIGLFVIDTGS